MKYLTIKFYLTIKMSNVIIRITPKTLYYMLKAKDER